MSQPAVFITVPKFVAITPVQTAGSTVTTIGGTNLPKIKPAPIQALTTDNTCNGIGEGEAATAPKGKKRRLDHLTWEEKVQRKKLKNRVAAQTSRDRKKARMEEMEHEIKDLTEKTEILVNKCESLQVINDSLMEKNQKLDMEVEILRQQLQELQKQQEQRQPQEQQKTVTCAGSGLKPQGLPVATGDSHRLEAKATAKEECSSIVPVASDSSLPALQDLLLPDIEIDEGALDDAEFDARKLEELAESLLADITADLEASDRESRTAVAEIASGSERLLGSVVGPTTECLESSKHKTHNNGCVLIDSLTNNTSASSNSISLQTPELTLENKFEETTEQTQNLTCTAITKTTALIKPESPEDATTPHTVYGTYDAKTNSITIVMDDVAIPVSEAVEEICCDGERNVTQDEVMCNTSSSMSSPSQVFLNVTAYSDDEADNDDESLNFDPIEKFLRPKRPLVSPLAKSPAPSLHSATSDHGYESILGSPSPPSLHHFEPLDEDLNSDDFSTWPPGFNELFPSLI